MASPTYKHNWIFSLETLLQGTHNPHTFTVKLYKLLNKEMILFPHNFFRKQRSTFPWYRKPKSKLQVMKLGIISKYDTA